jgi:hypothetical protein
MERIKHVVFNCIAGFMMGMGMLVFLYIFWVGFVKVATNQELGSQAAKIASMPRSK